MQRWRRVSLMLVTLALVASACGNNRKNTEATTPGGGGSTTTNASGASTFGDAPLPCGPAKGGTNTASDKGVTADTITIGTGDDRGFAQTPGLDKEMTEAVQDLAKLCNDAGGINGRKIAVKFYDAAILQVQQAMAKACSDNLFFLVGEGWALDSNQEETRVHCGLPAIPGYAVSAAFQNGPNSYEGMPVPAQENPSMPAEQIARLHPDAITAAATLAGNFSATQQTRDKVVASYPKFGFKFLPHSNIEYNITGESDWTPFIKQLKSMGAKFVYYSGECTFFLKVAQAAKLNGFNPIWATETNFYDAKCAASNTDGAMNGLYIRMAYTPFEERKVNKAVDDYMKMVEANHQQPAQLGMQATSSFLLWATAAKDCGANLTRECVLTKIKNTHKWTGHGLHTEVDPGRNQAPECDVLIQIQGTKFVRVAPKKANTFECDPKSVVTIDTPGVRAAKIGPDGISHQYG